MDTLDQKDSLQSQNAEEKALETTENQVSNEKETVEIPEETAAVAPEQPSEEEMNAFVEQVAEKLDAVECQKAEGEANAFIEQVAEKLDAVECQEVEDETDVFVEQVVEKPEVVELSAEEEKAEEAETPIVEEKPEIIESPVEEEKPEVVELPAEEEKAEEVETPVVEEKPEITASPVEEEKPEVVETVVVEEKPEETEPVSETSAEDYSQLSEEELVVKAKELLEEVGDSYAELKEKLDEIKHTFYKKFKYRQESLKKAFIEDGGVAEDFTAPEDELENQMKTVLNTYREKRNAEIQAVEKEKQDNLDAKNKIIEELKELLESTDDFGKKVPVFQKLQQDWKVIGQVPPAEVANLWKNYQLYVETFYDNLKINNELRDYDFRKNLEAKTALCEQAEKLADETDVIAAFRKLQILHEDWREIGPVSRENRESIWERFKNASTVINKRHHDHFDKLREGEAENLVLKTAICEKVEAIDATNLSAYKEWQDKTDEIVALQEEWKKIGFAPKKDNVAIYERFRTACDNFFQKKNEYYKAAKDVLVENLTKKITLCEKAEALKGSQNWKETADKMIQLQKDWKTIGSVPKKQSDAVWKRFIAACDYFFEQKGKNFKSQKDEQDSNLKRKKELIEQINALTTTELDQNEAFKTLKTLIVEWNEVGHVPFKEKDKLYKEYKTAIDAQFDRLNMDQASRRMDFFRANLEEMAEKGQQKLLGERKRLMRVYDTLNNDIATYENNIGFFSNSKNAAGMIKDMERKIAKLKEERELVVEKIKMLEETTKL